MVMKLNTGVPGSGKTYLLIKSFIDLFCTWDQETGRFVLKEEHKDKILISNIECLTLPHLDLETMMHERCMQLARTQCSENISNLLIDDLQSVIDEHYYKFLEEKVRWFFSYAYQKQLTDKHGPVIYLIEESQRYFDSKELGRQPWVRDVLFFFEKHRHFGHSIFCDTQHSSKLHKGIVALFETETRAKPRTLSVVGEFKYNEYADGAKTNQIPIIVQPDKRIYQTYKSMTHKEDVKTKRPVFKILLFVCFMGLFSIFILNYAKSNLGGSQAQAKTSQQTTPNSSGGSAPADTPSVSSQSGHWIHLSFIMNSQGEVIVVHPITNAIMPLVEFDMKVMRQGSQLFCFMEDTP